MVVMIHFSTESLQHYLHSQPYITYVEKNINKYRLYFVECYILRYS